MTPKQPDPLAVAIGEEIEFWRRVRKLSRGELGELAGLSETTIGRYARGSVDAPVTDTWRIAEALGVPFSDMIRRAEERLALESSDPDLRFEPSAAKKPRKPRIEGTEEGPTP